jgi:transcriptional regulator with XRE-family HTH domain
MTIGENIRQIRTDAGLTQTEVAERAGISQAYLSQIESDLRSMDVKAADKLASALGVTLNDLMREE